VGRLIAALEAGAETDISLRYLQKLFSADRPAVNTRFVWTAPRAL
jgi:hypothetical protein